MNLKGVIGGFHQARWPRCTFNKILCLLPLPVLVVGLMLGSVMSVKNEQMEKNGGIQLLENKINIKSRIVRSVLKTVPGASMH